MINRLPKVSTKRKICVICEGQEEYEYMQKLNSLNVWNEIYYVENINAGGNGSIAARYQDKYQNQNYEAIFVFCDTDKKPYEQYIDIKRKINDIHGKSDAADYVVIFGNPCTMQIIILHWEYVVLKSHKKYKNAPIIEKYTGIQNYRAKTQQRIQVFNTINEKNYQLMKKRVLKLSKNDMEIGSSNFDILLNNFSSKDSSWIEELNENLK